MTIRPSLRRGAPAVIADTFPDPDGRGRRVVVISNDSPDPENHPDAVLVSFDELPALIVPIPKEHLFPSDERACVTGDPACCLLEPCAGCVLILRAHLGAALQAARIVGESGTLFVKAWNEARASAKEGVRETARQARAYASQAASNHRPFADVIQEKAAAMQEAAGVLLQEAEAPGIEQHAEEVTNDSAEKGELSTAPGEVVEKKNVTTRRRARTKAPSPDAPSPEAAPPAQDGEAPGGPLGAEAVAGPRGG